MNRFAVVDGMQSFSVYMLSMVKITLLVFEPQTSM